MKVSRPVAFGMGVITALVIGSGTAYAATGGKFILGKSNAATTTTTLTNSRGTALALNSKAGTPPLRVNRTTKVPNLNADLLDGLDQSRFALTTGATATIAASGQLIDADENGSNDSIIAIATCPAGTKLTGGGGDDMTADGIMWSNSPAPGRSWFVGSTTATLTAENAAKVVAYAQCYNPRGSVPGGLTRVAPNAQTLEWAKAKAAAKLG